MATYAIGDAQGCLQPLLQLLEKIRFDARRDRLWLVGDLVNRGPESLPLLRCVRGLGDAASVVLGNHDLHLLGVVAGARPLGDNDTLADVLAAPDHDELIAWLRSRPLAHHEDGWLMVHAGVLPSWSLADTLRLAGEMEAALRGADWRARVADIFGSRPNAWSEALSGAERLRVITNVLTRMRYLAPDASLEFHHKGPHAPPPYRPWFELPGRRTAQTNIVFGHWSALGLVQRPHLLALDTGCLWGGKLSAARLDDGKIFQVDCPAFRAVAH